MGLLDERARKEALVESYAQRVVEVRSSDERKRILIKIKGSVTNENHLSPTPFTCWKTVVCPLFSEIRF